MPKEKKIPIEIDKENIMKPVKTVQDICPKEKYDNYFSSMPTSIVIRVGVVKACLWN